MSQKQSLRQIAARGLYPVRAYYRGATCLVELGQVPEDKFCKPFSQWELNRATNRSLIQIDSIADDPSITGPVGFVYHLSHVGSTLVGNMLREAPGYQVVSEPSSLGDCLLSPLGSGDEERFARLTKMVRLFCATSEYFGYRLVVKLPSWALLHSERLHQAFPETPSCLVRRNPAEILVSLTRDPPKWLRRTTVRELLGPTESPTDFNERFAALLGPEMNYRDEGPFVAFVSRFLASLLHAAISSSTPYLVVDYEELPNCVPDRIAPHFGIPVDDTTRKKMIGKSLYESKSRKEGRGYRDDRGRKQLETTPQIREYCESTLQPLLDKLEFVKKKSEG